MKKVDNLSLSARGLKYKLRIAFALMSILPLLISLYLVSNYIFPRIGLKADIAMTLLISTLIAVIGFWIVKGIFDRVQSMSADAKLIASGDLSRQVSVSSDDEVGYLGEALNKLTERIRTNMDELKSYGEKTNEINIGIQKRMLVLSSLLQIGSLISQSARIEDILKIAAEKSLLLANSESAYLLSKDAKTGDFTAKVSEGLNAQALLKVRIGSAERIFDKLVKFNKPLILDNENSLKDVSEAFSKKFGFKNTVAVPINFRGKVDAILGIGNNRPDFVYQKDDVDLLDIFAKQLAIAVENDMLTQRVEQLEIKDALTGLYNGPFIYARLQEEIKRAIAYQRPCAFLLLDVDGFQQYQQAFGSLHAEATLKKIALLVKNSISEIDRVARSGDNEFAVVLPEKNKRKAQELAEEIRKKIEYSFREEPDEKKRLTVSAGVSENPLDGVESEELLAKAKQFLEAAKEQGKNRVVAFIPDSKT